MTLRSDPRLISAIQVVGSCLILAWVPGNYMKLALLLLLWGLTFGRLSMAEWMIAAVACLIFTGMNVGALKEGVFAFAEPDVLGLLPVWELLMWGFYVLNGLRTLRGSPPLGSIWWAVGLAVLFSIPFSTIHDPGLLLGATAAVLLLAFARFHERLDFLYAGYFVLLGALIEYSGVWSGQWHYPGAPWGGVPFWFITMWGGVGLFVRRLLRPFVTGATDVADTRA